jgi:hypothetical protein
MAIDGYCWLNYHYLLVVIGGYFVVTPLWAKCEGEAHTPKSWELGVLRDSRKFRAQVEGPKHLALGCSWCH